MYRVDWMDTYKGRQWEREENMSDKENHCAQVDGIEGWKDIEGSIRGPHIPENIPSHIDFWHWSSQLQKLIRKRQIITITSMISN